jgi:hypothetical protein
MREVSRRADATLSMGPATSGPDLRRTAAHGPAGALLTYLAVDHAGTDSRHTCRASRYLGQGD